MGSWRRALAGVVPLVLLGVAEGGLRVYPGVGALLFPWESQVALATDLGPEPSDGPYRWTWHEDRRGFRQLNEVPGATRTFVLAGDSWVWGYQVTQGRTLGDRLQVRLAEALGSPVRVIAAGRPGASALEISGYARSGLAEAPGAELVIVQPHNPRRTHVDGRPDPPWKPLPPPEIAVYRGVRRLLAPWVWARAPRMLDGVMLGEALEEVSRLAQGQRTWLLLTPQERTTATTGRFGAEHEWVDLRIPWAGHGLTERSCWSWTDPFHPSEAGTDALAQVLAARIAGGEDAWKEAPSCDDAEGVGPGK